MAINKQAIVVYHPKGVEEAEYFGPFPDSKSASDWGFAREREGRWKSLDWSWDFVRTADSLPPL